MWPLTVSKGSVAICAFLVGFRAWAVDSASKSRSLEVSVKLVPMLDIAEFIRNDCVERMDGKNDGI